MHIHRWGIVAEYFVIIRYMLRFYLPIKHRWRCPQGEIDLIFKRGSLLVFCEVKARTSEFTVDNPVTLHQQKRIVKAAEKFLASDKLYENSYVRFDLAIVKNFFSIKIYKNWLTE